MNTSTITRDTQPNGEVVGKGHINVGHDSDMLQERWLRTQFFAGTLCEADRLMFVEKYGDPVMQRCELEAEQKAGTLTVEKYKRLLALRGEHVPFDDECELALLLPKEEAGTLSPAERARLAVLKR